MQATISSHLGQALSTVPENQRAPMTPLACTLPCASASSTAILCLPPTVRHEQAHGRPRHPPHSRPQVLVRINPSHGAQHHLLGSLKSIQTRRFRMRNVSNQARVQSGMTMPAVTAIVSARKTHVPTLSLPPLSYPPTCLHIRRLSSQPLLHPSPPLQNLFIVSIQVTMTTACQSTPTLLKPRKETQLTATPQIMMQRASTLSHTQRPTPQEHPPQQLR